MKKNVITILMVIVILLALLVGRPLVYNRIIERTGYWQGDAAHITERVMKIDLYGNVTSVISEKDFTIRNVSLDQWLTDDLYSY